MKHFCGIIAHSHAEHLNLLCKDLKSKGIEFSIHLDAKSRNAMMSEMDINQQAILENSFKVYRGHYSIVKASLELMRESLKVNYDYFHLISGEDLIHNSAEELDQIILKNGNVNFMNFYSIPIGNESKVKNGIPMEHYRHYALDDGLGLVKSKHFPANPWIQAMHKSFGKWRSYWRIYHRLFARKMPDIHFYAGSAWFSVKREMIEYFVEQERNQNPLFKFFENALFPDELIFQTLALNSHFAEDILNNDLRYIKWSENSPKRPVVLDQKEWQIIRESQTAFSRKWRLNINQYEQLATSIHV